MTARLKNLEYTDSFPWTGFLENTDSLVSGGVQYMGIPVPDHLKLGLGLYIGGGISNSNLI